MQHVRESVNPDDKEVKEAGVMLATNKVISMDAVMAVFSELSVIHTLK